MPLIFKEGTIQVDTFTDVGTKEILVLLGWRENLQNILRKNILCILLMS